MVGISEQFRLAFSCIVSLSSLSVSFYYVVLSYCLALIHPSLCLSSNVVLILAPSVGPTNLEVKQVNPESVHLTWTVSLSPYSQVNCNCYGSVVLVCSLPITVCWLRMKAP